MWILSFCRMIITGKLGFIFFDTITIYVFFSLCNAHSLTPPWRVTSGMLGWYPYCWSDTEIGWWCYLVICSGQFNFIVHIPFCFAILFCLLYTIQNYFALFRIYLFKYDLFNQILFFVLIAPWVRDKRNLVYFSIFILQFFDNLTLDFGREEPNGRVLLQQSLSLLHCPIPPLR